MPDYVKPYIDKIETFAKARGEAVELLLVGGLALSLYGLPRYTIDIDGEIKCGSDTYFEFLEYLKKDGAAFNLSGNISGWGIVPLPPNYQERAKTVQRRLSSKGENLYNSPKILRRYYLKRNSSI